MKALLLLALVTMTGRAAEPERGAERIVLHTVAGDVVLALYPKVAPRNAAQMLTLFRHGIFDSTHFFRVEPGFVMQTSRAEDRQIPLSPKQKALLMRLPTEVSPGVKHKAWRLSMARLDNDWESAESSFSILLGEAPHLDGHYTVFGEVTDGFDAVSELLKVGWTSASRPLARLTIKGTTVYDSPEALARATLAPAQKVTTGFLPLDDAERKWRTMWGLGLLAMLAVAALAFFLRLKLTSSQLVSLHLFQALIAGFFLMILWLPLGQRTPWIGLGLFALCLVLFKAMNRFEAKA